MREKKLKKTPSPKNPKKNEFELKCLTIFLSIFAGFQKPTSSNSKADNIFRRLSKADEFKSQAFKSRQVRTRKPTIFLAGLRFFLPFFAGLRFQT